MYNYFLTFIDKNSFFNLINSAIYTDASICSTIHPSIHPSVIRKTNSGNYLFDHRNEKVDFARNGYTTECINLDEKQRAGELSVDRGSGFLFEASIKGCCRLLRETFLSLSLSFSSSLPLFPLLEGYKSSNISSAVFRPVEERRRGDSGSVRGSRARFKGVAKQQWQPLPMRINILASDATYFCRYKWRHLEDQYLPRSPSIIRDPIALCLRIFFSLFLFFFFFSFSSFLPK